MAPFAPQQIARKSHVQEFGARTNRRETQNHMTDRNTKTLAA